MRLFTIIFFIILSINSWSQVNRTPPADKPGAPISDAPVQKATIDQYRIITLERDTTYVDTSLSIKSEYKFNYLRRDIFGLLPFANEGQTYNILDVTKSHVSPFPNAGYEAKHFNFLEASQINYYSAATPFTELYFKSVMEQGQNVDAFITLNTSERLNFSVAYKGLRSLGKYINQLSTSGNFRFTTSYNTLNKRYYANFHFVAQDIFNGENGGIVNINDFESGDDDFKNRARLEVYLKDAQSTLNGKRLFLDHSFRINSKEASNNLYINHQFNHEYKFFEYKQLTVPSTLTNSDATVTVFNRFGAAYEARNISDQSRYNKLYNKLGAVYENTTLGKFQFFIEDFRYNYFFSRILILNSGAVPALLSDEINTIGGEYEYRKNKWRGTFLYSNSISNQPMSTLDANMEYTLNADNKISFQFQNISKVPNHQFNLYQSSYVDYNWSNDFSNEKISIISINAQTQYLSAQMQVQSLQDRLYYSDVSTIESAQIVRPNQYGKSINYLSLKLSREFRFRNFALDNTFLYQQVDQEDNILNVPKIVTRNTLYYSNHFFKKALYLQTGVIFNYFTKYYSNDYSPVLGEFFVQDQRQIGDFPMLDFFVNVRVRQTRIFLKAEHFNSSLTGNDYYSAPNYPAGDFIVRFGLVWNFFQ